MPRTTTLETNVDASQRHGVDLEPLVMRGREIQRMFDGDTEYCVIGISQDEIGQLVSGLLEASALADSRGKYERAKKYDRLRILLCRRFELSLNSA